MNLNYVSFNFLYENIRIVRKIGTAMIKKMYWSPCKVTVIVVISECNFNILDEFSKNISTSNYTYILPKAAPLLPLSDGWANGRTENHGECKSYLTQFCERARKERISMFLGVLNLPFNHLSPSL